MAVRGVLLLVLVLMMGCGKDRHAVAVVGGERITDSQFVERYKQYLTSTSQQDNILLRQQVLNNMINENLIYRELARRGFDRDEAYQAKLQDLSTQAMLIAYARRIVADTSSIREEELYREFRAYNSKVTARYLYAKSESGARELRAKLEHGATFEDLAKNVFEDPGLANNGGSLGTFGWGDMDAALEGAAFSIPIGTVSEPVRMPVGYAIVKVEHRVENQFMSEADYVKVREKLWRRVLERRFGEIIDGELRSIEKDLAPSFNQSVVGDVFGSWQVLTGQTSPAPPSEFASSAAADLSAKELVRFKNSVWSVGEFVKRLMKTTERQKSRVRRPEDVKSMAIGLATREVLVEKAKQMGLASDQTVLDGIRHGKEEYLLKRWDSSVIDTVGASGWDERILRKRFEETRNERTYPPEVNVAEILVRTEGEANRLMKQLRERADFAELARKNSLRIWAAKRGGELGFGNEAHYGPMGKKFFSAKVGQIIGPEKVDPYFGIFKVLDRREGRAMTFDKAEGQIIDELTQTRKLEARKHALDQLRAGVSISVDNDILANIPVN